MFDEWLNYLDHPSATRIRRAYLRCNISHRSEKWRQWKKEDNLGNEETNGIFLKMMHFGDFLKMLKY